MEEVKSVNSIYCKGSLFWLVIASLLAMILLTETARQAGFADDVLKQETPSVACLRFVPGRT